MRYRFGALGATKDVREVLRLLLNLSPSSWCIVNGIVLQCFVEVPISSWLLLVVEYF